MEFVLCWPTIPGYEACPSVWWIYAVTLHWRKLIFIFASSNLLQTSSWLGVGPHVCHPPLSGRASFGLNCSGLGVCYCRLSGSYVQQSCCVRKTHPGHCCKRLRSKTLLLDESYLEHSLGWEKDMFWVLMLAVNILHSPSRRGQRKSLYFEPLGTLSQFRSTHTSSLCTWFVVTVFPNRTKHLANEESLLLNPQYVGKAGYRALFSECSL